MDRTNKLLRREPDDGVINCVWMDAGVVNYKLCDRSYDCEHCAFDEAFHGQHAALPIREDRFRVQGCEVARDLFYHPTHSWLRIEENGEVRIGLDDFGRRLLGAAYAVSLPSEETPINRGEPSCRLAIKSGVVTLFSPVSGTITKTNSLLALRPSLVNRDPYDSGWLMLVEPIDLEASLKRLFYGPKVGIWLSEEVEKLKLLIANLANDEHSMAVTLNDGGLLTAEFLKDFDVEQTRRVISSFFPLTTNGAEHKSAIVVTDGR